MELEHYSKTRIEVVQSYIVTTARYDFNVYEKRILYRIVEGMQHLLAGKKLNQRYVINKQLWDLWEVKIPMAAFLIDETDTNHARIKAALLSMSRKIFTYEDDREWRAIPLILLPKIKKYESTVEFRLHDDVYNALMNFSKGYKKYELTTAFEFESVYAMRFYELFSKQRTPLNYSVTELKIMFGVEKKYKNTADFIKRVVMTAQKELNEKSPHSFEYTPLKTGRRITSIRFFPVYIAANMNEAFEGEHLAKQISPSLMIEKIVLDYLKDHYKFSTPELKNNATLFEKAGKEIPDLLLFLSEIKASALRATNPKGYVIGALKKKLGVRTVKQEASGKAKKDAKEQQTKPVGKKGKEQLTAEEKAQLEKLK